MIYKRIGGYAALLQAVLWIVFVVFIAIINPRLGLASPDDLSNPDVLLPVLRQSPALILFPALDFIVGVSLLLVVVRVDQLLQAPAWSRYGVVFGAGAGLLFIVLAASRLNTLPLLADQYAGLSSTAAAQFVLVDALHTGLTAAIRFTLGVWLLAASADLRPQSKALAYLGLLAGLVNLVGAFVPPAAGLNILLFPIWFFGLARWLFSASSFHIHHRAIGSVQEKYS